MVASGRSCAAKCRCQGTRAARVVTSRVSTRALGRASNVRVSGLGQAVTWVGVGHCTWQHREASVSDVPGTDGGGG
jgi:hypothetical protein